MQEPIQVLEVNGYMVVTVSIDTEQLAFAEKEYPYTRKEILKRASRTLEKEVMRLDKLAF